MKYAETHILDVRVFYSERGPEIAIACPCFAAAIGLAWQFALFQTGIFDHLAAQRRHGAALLGSGGWMPPASQRRG